MCYFRTASLSMLRWTGLSSRAHDAPFRFESFGIRGQGHLLLCCGRESKERAPVLSACGADPAPRRAQPQLAVHRRALQHLYHLAGFQKALVDRVQLLREAHTGAHQNRVPLPHYWNCDLASLVSWSNRFELGLGREPGRSSELVSVRLYLCCSRCACIRVCNRFCSHLAECSSLPVVVIQLCCGCSCPKEVRAWFRFKL